MPADFVERSRDRLAPQLVGPVSRLLAISADEARNAVHIAVPALLACFADVAATSKGSSVLCEAAEQACTANVVAVNASGPRVLAKNGLETLQTLLGQDNLEALASALGKFAGMNVRGGSLLLGAVAPATLAYLGEQRGSLDQGPRLVSLLSEQRTNIMAAIPANLSKLIGSSRWPDRSVAAAHAGPIACAGTVRGASSTAPKPANGTSATQGRAEGGLSLIRGMGLLVAGVLIVGISQVMFGERFQMASQMSHEVTEQAAKPFASLVVDKVDLGADFGSGIIRLGQTLGGMTDIASAKAALPELQDISGSFNKLNRLAGRLPASGQSRLTDLAERAMPILQAEINKAYAIPAAADVLKPVLDPLMTSIAGLAKKPA